MLRARTQAKEQLSIWDENVIAGRFPRVIKTKESKLQRERKAEKQRSLLLGRSFGPAVYLLKKMLLFSFAKKLGLTTCFQCGREIDSIKGFSVEHKVPWMSAPDPYDAFFNLDNIAFSHMSCNAAAALRPQKKYPTIEEGRTIRRKQRYADPEIRTVINAKKRAYRAKTRTRLPGNIYKPRDGNSKHAEEMRANPERHERRKRAALKWFYKNKKKKEAQHAGI